jgi:hypothetical protein
MNEATIARDAAIETVASGADQHWLDIAFDCVCTVAARHETFIVDAVWRELESRDYKEPPEGRAMGAVMVRAVKAGIITGTTEYRASDRRSAHANPRRVWRSLVYAPAPPQSLFEEPAQSSYGSI